MNTLFWCITVLTLIIVIIYIIKNRSYFSILTYTVFGVYIPLFMSFFNWSSYSVIDKGILFYWVFISLDIVCIIYCILPIKPMNKIDEILVQRKKNVFPLEILNIIYIGSVLIENKYLSGFFFPSLHGIDVHTGRMPGIYFITTAIYIIVISTLLEYVSTKKIRYILYAVVAFLINVISKSSRIDAAITFVQIGSILLFYFFYKNNSKKGLIKKITFILICLIVSFFIINGGIKVGNNRMNSNGLYNLVYSEGIGYKGPKTKNEILEYYYGYFPMSFDNLAYNLQYNKSKMNLIGLNSFRCLYFGILQFDNLFGLNGSSAPRSNIIRCKAAAVTTIFWDFYYDFDIFIFVPIFVVFIIAYWLSKKITKKQNLVYLMIYFYWIPLWMFSSFDNRSFDYQVIWHILLINFLLKKRYIVNIRYKFNKLREKKETKS